MQDQELNASIARWMGEEKKNLCTHCGRETDAPVGYGECDIARVEIVSQSPDYLHDPAAALDLLSRMNDALGFKDKSYLLEYIGGDKAPWVIWRREHSQYVLVAEAATPCAAICAAWKAEFGGEA